MWTAVHLGISPTCQTIRTLDDWQKGLIYETAMSYPIEGMRHSYFERKKSISNFDVDDLLDAGYSMEEIAAIKGK